MKRQRFKFPWDLYWENKTHKRKRSIDGPEKLLSFTLKLEVSVGLQIIWSNYQYIIWIFDFGPVKLPGRSRNGPQEHSPSESRLGQSWAGLFKAGLRKPRVSAKYKFRYESLKIRLSLILFACNVMNWCSKKNSENYPGKCFWTKEQETQNKP